MNETLQEFVDSRGVAVRVDHEQGVLRGVKILGLQSRNGRRYVPEVLAKAAALYEGAKVNVNHPQGHPAGPRDYRDRIGVIRNVAIRPEEGLFADFHFNPKHALAEQLVWDAQHAPENVGLSHNVVARTVRRGPETVVEDILRVESVDLVADPATTHGLFEAAAGAVSTEELAHAMAGLTLEQLNQCRPELVAQILSGQAAELEQARSQLKQLQQSEASRQRQQRVRLLLSEFQLPDPDSGDAWAQMVVGPRFLDQLLASPDEQAMRELLEERVRLIRAAGQRQGSSTGTPLSREQSLIEPASALDTQAFVEAIT